MSSVQILCGDALQVLETLPAESVHACITSPPFLWMRDYGHPEQIGLEETPNQYVEKLVAVFREVRRVLRPDGTLWLNLGDTYAGSRRGQNGDYLTGRHVVQSDAFVRSKRQGPRWGGGDVAAPGLVAKQLIGIPWRVAFALQDDGWILRTDIIWQKPAPTPDSVRDRPTRAHEYIFLFAKERMYYYNRAAIREPAISSKPSGNGFHRPSSISRGGPGQAARWVDIGGMRNRRSVWTVAPDRAREGHKARFPERLVEPMVLAGCPVGGTVLDPFAGSGTTGRVALRHGRNAILIELNPEYCEMARRRTSSVPVLLPLHHGEKQEGSR